MLFSNCVLAIFINFVISGINCEELSNNTDNTTSEPTVTAAISASTGNDLNLLLTSENLQTTPESIANTVQKKNETFPTTSANLGETSSSSSNTNFNDLSDIETTPSWELIYPEKNSTLQPSLTSDSLPKYFKVDDVTNCEKFFGQCLAQVLGKVVPKLKDGNKSLYMPSLDPIYFNATAFQYNSGPFAGFVTIRYAHIYGLTAMKFKNVDFYKQNDKFKARLTILLPKMKVTGAYKGDMHVNNVRVTPKGDFNVTIMGLGIDLLSLGVVYRKEDHTFLKFTKGNATTTLKDSKVNATGIFPDQRLDDIVVNVANQYWRDLFTVVLLETRNNWLPILLNALNAALDMVPFDFFEIKSSRKN